MLLKSLLSAGLLMMAGTLLPGCANLSLEKWARANREHREFAVRKVWVRSALETPNTGYRKINRMKPIITGSVLLTGNAIDGLVAFDRDSGQELWRLPTVNGIEGGAALVKDRLFFGASDGLFYSVDSRNGHVLWSFPTNAETLSEPFLDTTTGVVYVLTSANVVHALDAESGRPLWVFSRQNASNFSIRGGSRPALKGETLYVGFADGFFTALNTKNGQVRWEVQLNRNKRFKDIDTSAIVDGDRIYVAGYDDRLYCLSAEKGDILWRIDKGGYATPTLAGERIYYPTSGGEVMALDRTSGATIWKYQVSDGIATTLVPYRGLLVFGESLGRLVFLDAASGKATATFEPGHGVFSTPAVDEKNGKVYFISNDANVYAIDASWHQDPGFAYLHD